jgi:hypothetical protein
MHRLFWYLLWRQCCWEFGGVEKEKFAEGVIERKHRLTSKLKIAILIQAFGKFLAPPNL